jgi:hypothetical protein
MLSIASPQIAITSTTFGGSPNASFVPRVVDDFAWCEQADTVADELEAVFVGRCDDDVVPLRLARERSDQVVGFPILDTDHRNPKSFENFIDERKLHRKVIRHRPAVFLVVGVRLVTRLGGADVERDGDAIGRVILEQLAQHLREAVDRVRRQAGGVRQPTNREVGAIDVVGTVDDEEGGLFRHGRRIIEGR